MRALLAFIFVTSFIGLTGCESDVPPAPNASNGVNTLERGISGQGTLTQPDKSDDPVYKGQQRSGN